MKVLVTGAAGFIGAHLVSALTRAGADVRGFDRDEPPNGVADWVRGDVTDRVAVGRAIEGCDAVMHLAAVYSYYRRDAEAMLRVNVEGTRSVLEAAGARRVVHTSSAATCGPVAGRPAHEGDSPPAWELKVSYKRSKIASEQLARDAAASGRDVVIVNPTTPVGPGDRRPTPTGKMIRDVARGGARAFVRTTALNIVSVEDVAAGQVAALERGRAGERYLLGGDDLELSEIFAHVARAAGRRPPRVAIPYPLVHAAARIADRALRPLGREPEMLVLDAVRLARVPARFSCEKARRELGYSWRPAEQALTEAVRAISGQ
jgi:dihydroflavonol-4-reductase